MYYSPLEEFKILTIKNIRSNIYDLTISNMTIYLILRNNNNNIFSFNFN